MTSAEIGTTVVYLVLAIAFLVIALKRWRDYGWSGVCTICTIAAVSVLWLCLHNVGWSLLSDVISQNTKKMFDEFIY